MTADFYKTIEGEPEPSVYKDRGSKFIGYAVPVQSEAGIKRALARIRKEHHKARHWCYAWRLGYDPAVERANDDGEPARSAGMPILNQIRGRDLTDVLVVVVRYFGGVKLGVGGLIQAYKTAASEVLDHARIVEKPILKKIHIRFGYDQMNRVMQWVKKNGLKTLPPETAADVRLTLLVPPGRWEEINSALDNMTGIKRED